MQTHNQIFRVEFSSGEEVDISLQIDPDYMTGVRMLQEVSEHIIKLNLQPSQTSKIINVEWRGGVGENLTALARRLSANTKLQNYLSANFKPSYPIGWLSSEMIG